MLPISHAYRKALYAPFRETDIRIKVTSRGGALRVGHHGIKLEDGDIQHDWTDHLNSPVSQANLTLIDEQGILDPDLKKGAANTVWFDARLYIEYGLHLPSGKWEYCPVYDGWIEEVTRIGDQLMLHSLGRECRHQEPYVLPHSWEIEPSTKKTQAIIDLLNHRGVDSDNLIIPVTEDDPVFQRYVHFGLGDSPWKIVQFIADDLDQQLYYRMNRKVKLRDWPTEKKHASWIFTGNEKSIITDFPEQRFSINDFSNVVYVLTDRVVDDGPLSVDRPEPVVGYAALPENHALSVETLSAGNKPIIKILDRPHIRTFTRANEIADEVLSRRTSGLETEVSITCLPLPHLEVGDLLGIKLKKKGIDVHKFRLRKFNFPLTPDGEMNINWSGTARPDPRTKRHGSRKGRRDRWHWGGSRGYEIGSGWHDPR